MAPTKSTLRWRMNCTMIQATEKLPAMMRAWASVCTWLRTRK